MATVPRSTVLRLRAPPTYACSKPAVKSRTRLVVPLNRLGQRVGWNGLRRRRSCSGDSDGEAGEQNRASDGHDCSFDVRRPRLAGCRAHACHGRPPRLAATKSRMAEMSRVLSTCAFVIPARRASPTPNRICRPSRSAIWQSLSIRWVHPWPQRFRPAAHRDPGGPARRRSRQRFPCARRARTGARTRVRSRADGRAIGSRGA